MPYRRRGSFRRRSNLRPVNSNKNVVEFQGSTGTTLSGFIIALSVDSALNTVANQVNRGSIIKAFWLAFDVCGLAASGVLQKTNMYIIKNPGANLTAPGAFSVGTSNEKKFVIKQWSAQTMRNQDGNPPYHWEGWIKIPKPYQRFGADDNLTFNVQVDAAAGHITAQAIYKWFQ